MLLESILIQNNILWRINYVLIKILLDASLLYEKSWNECKNSSFLHKATFIEWDHGSVKMWRCLFTFMALNSRRLYLQTCGKMAKMIRTTIKSLGINEWFTFHILEHYKEINIIDQLSERQPKNVPFQMWMPFLHESTEFSLQAEASRMWNEHLGTVGWSYFTQWFTCRCTLALCRAWYTWC